MLESVADPRSVVVDTHPLVLQFAAADHPVSIIALEAIGDVARGLGSEGTMLVSCLPQLIAATGHPGTVYQASYALGSVMAGVSGPKTHHHAAKAVQVRRLQQRSGRSVGRASGNAAGPGIDGCAEYI